MAVDIKEMLRRVTALEAYRGALRSLWWTDGSINAKPNEYESSIHLFGIASSPFCAISALQKTVADFGNPRLMNMVKENFYGDNCLISMDDANVDQQTAIELVDVLHRGGLEL